MNDYNIGDLVKVKKSKSHLLVKSGSIGLITEVKESAIDEIGYFVFFDDKQTFLMYHKELELVS
jgi:hypothetical protein